MKPNELMIGDYVLYEGEPHKVCSIDDYGFVLLCPGDNAEINSERDLLPIPITHEILEKNGFGYIEKDEELTHYYLGKPWYCENMDLHIGTNNLGHYWINDHRNTLFGIYYVHELQHALRMFGAEVEIKL